MQRLQPCTLQFNDDGLAALLTVMSLRELSLQGSQIQLGRAWCRRENTIANLASCPLVDFAALASRHACYRRENTTADLSGCLLATLATLVIRALAGRAFPTVYSSQLATLNLSHCELLVSLEPLAALKARLSMSLSVLASIRTELKKVLQPHYWRAWVVFSLRFELANAWLWEVQTSRACSVVPGHMQWLQGNGHKGGIFKAIAGESLLGLPVGAWTCVHHNLPSAFPILACAGHIPPVKCMGNKCMMGRVSGVQQHSVPSTVHVFSDS
eukprot:scaffold66041_cov21-Tisochrysis_lutea.AAC.6